jgi:UDP-glucuronate 4-epimerase
VQETIMVTGGAGFIGSHLVDKLLKNNKVIVVDDFNDFYSPLIKRNNIEEHLKNPDYKLYELDIAEYEQLETVFAENKIDKVVHLAARAGVRPSLDDPQIYTRTNINGTVNLLELCKNYCVNHFVFGSSSSVYGISEKVPFKEDFDISKPISPYAATKATGEAMCYTFSHLYGIRCICLRFFTVYGPRQRPDLAIYKFTKLIEANKPIPVFGDGSAKRDYTYVEDILQGLIAAISYNKSNFEICNLGESRTIELSRLIELLELNLGKKAEIKRLPNQKGDVPITYADVSRAKELLGYNPSTAIEDGIRYFIDWYRSVNS